MTNERENRPTTADIAAMGQPTQLDAETALHDDRAPVADQNRVHSRGSDESEEPTTPLIEPSRVSSLRERWLGIQGEFVDEPRQAVEQADALVADIIQELASSFAHQREELEHQWDQDADVDTESLRMALRHYRSFMDRLLAA